MHTAVVGLGTLYDFAVSLMSESSATRIACATDLVRCFTVQSLSGRVMRGGSLAAFLAAHGGRLPEAEVQVLAYCILSGLQNMHAGGYCHLDVKPANVGLAEAGDLGTAALMDYGSAEPIGVVETSHCCVTM